MPPVRLLCRAGCAARGCGGPFCFKTPLDSSCTAGAMLADLSFHDQALEAALQAHLRRGRRTVVVRWAAFRAVLVAAVTVR